MGTLNEDLNAIKTVEDKLIANKVANFAYTDYAYEHDDANGVPEYNYNNEQNIPNANATTLKVNSTILNKGWRSQSSSITRMLMNHFLGRLSYNLNKVNDNMSNLIATLMSHRGTANGFATLDENGRIPYAQLPESAIEFKGTWDADTNTPTLADGTGTLGDMYLVSVAGTQDLGSGEVTYLVGDRLIYNGSVWTKLSGGAVRSVNNVTPANDGNITLTKSDIDLGNVANTADSATPTENGTTKFTTGGAYALLTSMAPAWYPMTVYEAGDLVTYNGKLYVAIQDSQSSNWSDSNFTVVNMNTNLVTGVKGDNESDYRRGRVNITKADVGLSEVPNLATNDLTPTYTVASTLASLSSGEKLSVAFGKIAKAVADFISHKNNTSNPHSVTKAQVGLSNVVNTGDSATPINNGTTKFTTGGAYQFFGTSNPTVWLNKVFGHLIGRKWLKASASSTAEISDFYSANIIKILEHPTNGVKLALSSNKGLWWSTNGKTWSKVSNQGSTSCSCGCWVSIGSTEGWAIGCSDGMVEFVTYSAGQVTVSGMPRTGGSAVKDIICIESSRGFPSGVIVIGTTSGCYYNTTPATWSSFTQIAGAISSYTVSKVLAFGSEGRVLAGTAGYGVYNIDEYFASMTQLTGMTSDYVVDMMFVQDSGEYLVTTQNQGGTTGGKLWYYDNGALVQCTGYSVGSGKEAGKLGYANGIYYAGSTGAGLFYSTDARTFSRVNNIPSTLDIYAIAYGYDLLLVATSSNIWYSSDGVNFKQETDSPTGKDLVYSDYNNNYIWLCGGSDSIWYSNYETV